eukprot:COSAG06_NODE_5179_length_3656_cov_3.704245_4_plen_168_part_00
MRGNENGEGGPNGNGVPTEHRGSGVPNGVPTEQLELLAMMQQLLSATIAPVLAQVNAVVERQDVLERRGSLSMIDSGDAPNAVVAVAEPRGGRLEDLGGVPVTRVAATNVEAACYGLAASTRYKPSRRTAPSARGGDPLTYQEIQTHTLRIHYPKTHKRSGTTAAPF